MRYSQLAATLLSIDCNVTVGRRQPIWRHLATATYLSETAGSAARKENSNVGGTDAKRGGGHYLPDVNQNESSSFILLEKIALPYSDTLRTTHECLYDARRFFKNTEFVQRLLSENPKFASISWIFTEVST